jgi:hypothetical protein
VDDPIASADGPFENGILLQDLAPTLIPVLEVADRTLLTLKYERDVS